MKKSEEQINNIYNLITELSSGNLDFRADIIEGDDELNAVIIGINMLAEELQSTTVSKDYLDRIYKGVTDMLFILDENNIIIQVNNAVTQVLGYTEKELIGKPFSLVFVRADSISFNRIYNELNKKGICQNIDRSLKTKKGRTIHVSISGSLLNNPDTHHAHKLFIIKDISKIKKTEEQLRATNEELNTFIYRASHDLKGPVASIIGLINLATDEMQTDATIAHTYMDMISQSAHRLNAVLMEFLELGHITQSSIKYSYINFNQLIAEVLESLQYTAGFPQTEFILNIQSNLDYRSKRPLVKAIIHNLIENALKYRKMNTNVNQVNISITGNEQEISVQVNDNGIGMSKRVLENVFKMFYRGTESSEGTSLGLYIVQKSVEVLKAKISIKSKENVGTTVFIKIPNKLPRKKNLLMDEG